MEEVGGEAEFFCAFFPALDFGEGDAEFLGDGPEGFFLFLQKEDLTDFFEVGFGFFEAEVCAGKAGPEVVCFVSDVVIDEAGAAVHLFDVVEGDFVGGIGIGTAAEFAGFEVADFGMGDGDADGDDGVEEGCEHGTAEHGVAGHGFVSFAFGGVGDDEDGDVVFFAEAADFGHEPSGGLAFFHVGAEEGDVVHEDDLEAVAAGFFDGAEDDVLGVVRRE